MNTRPGCIASTALRFYISTQAVFMWFFSVHEDRSMLSRIAAFPEGATVFWMMFVCGMVGILDVLVNDVLRRPLWLYVRHNRHFGFLAIAFTHASLTFIAALKVDSPVLVLSSLWNAIFVIGFSLLDAHQRSVELIKEQAAYASRQPT